MPPSSQQSRFEGTFLSKLSALFSFDIPLKLTRRKLFSFKCGKTSATKVRRTQSPQQKLFPRQSVRRVQQPGGFFNSSLICSTHKTALSELSQEIIVLDVRKKKYEWSTKNKLQMSLNGYVREWILASERYFGMDMCKRARESAGWLWVDIPCKNVRTFFVFAVDREESLLFKFQEWIELGIDSNERCVDQWSRDVERFAKKKLNHLTEYQQVNYRRVQFLIQNFLTQTFLSLSLIDLTSCQFILMKIRSESMRNILCARYFMRNIGQSSRFKSSKDLKLILTRWNGLDVTFSMLKHLFKAMLHFTSLYIDLVAIGDDSQ